MPLNNINNIAKKYESYVIESRRLIHRYAETMGNEFKTSNYIKKEAEKLNLEIIPASNTGLVIVMNTNKPGNGVALRADMDALPIKENPKNLKCDRVVVSEDANTSHMCGHDGHVAMLLGAMKVLNEIKDELSGTIYFCFEEGEEGGDGYKGILEVLSRFNIQTCFAIHLLSYLDSGLISIEEGPRMSGQIRIESKFIGKGGHGSRPDKAINPVYCAANAICNLAVAAENQLDVEKTITLGITSIESDNSWNVIADSATVIGSLRFFDFKEGEKALALYKKVFDNTAAMHNCSVEHNGDPTIIFSPVVTDSDASKLAREAITQTLGKEYISKADKWFASEPFSKYLDKYKGVFAFVGIKNLDKGCGAEHHSEYFDIDEDALINGCIATCAYAVAALESKEVTNWKK